MIITPHFLVGAAIATNIPNPILGLPLAFLSHFFLDFIPHRDYPAFQKISAREGRKGPLAKFFRESLTGFLKVTAAFSIAFSTVLFFADNMTLAAIGGFLAISPDFDTLAVFFPRLFQNRFFKLFFDFHAGSVHYLEKKEIPIFWKIFSQIAAVVLAIFFL